MKSAAIKKFIPKPFRKTIKYGMNAAADVADLLRGKTDALVPPRRINYGGHQGFVECGDTYLSYFADLGRLRPDEHVLEVGCGFGRIARPLAGFLSGQGSYTGIDIVKSGVDWLTKAYSGYPNFSFRLSDLRNTTYNPTGTCDASSYTFPFESETFDFVILISVFTHMLPAEVENYLREIARVLRRGGRCYITYFLLNEESTACVNTGKASFLFTHALPGYRSTNTSSPLDAVAFDETYIRKLYAESGLTLAEPIHYGSWCHERTNPLDLQDIVIGVKA